MIKAIFFDLDNTLHNATKLVEKARKESCKAMVKAGLPFTTKKAYSELMKIVKKYGANYNKHFNKLCDKFKAKNKSEIIASGVIAYHRITAHSLRLFPKTKLTLKKLKKQRLKLAIVTKGLPIKQWEKILRLGIKNFFSLILISEDASKEILFKRAMNKLKLKPSEVLCVGDRIKSEIKIGNKLGMTTARVLKGRFKNLKPENKSEIADYDIKNIYELPAVIKHARKT